MFNPQNFIREMSRTPNPEETLGIFYEKPYISYDRQFGIKRWKKIFINGKLKYVFDAIWLI